MIDRSDTKFVIVSASGTPSAMDFGAYELGGWYEGKKSRFWCPWHFVIRRSGTVDQGRSVQYRGEAPAGYKAISLSVLLVGGQNEEKYCKPKANYSDEQYLALEALCGRLSARYPGVRILGLSDLPGVAVRGNPGFDVALRLRARNAEVLQENVDGTTNSAAAGAGPAVQHGPLADLPPFHGEVRGLGAGEPQAPREVARDGDYTSHGVL